MHRPPSIGQTDLDPEEQGSRQPPSTHAWVRKMIIMIMTMMKTIITLVKLQSASRSQGRTRFSEAEADSPVSWATEVPTSRSSPDIILWLYSPDITLILLLYSNPLSGPSGAPMATWQHGCLKQGSMVVTGAHKAAPDPGARETSMHGSVRLVRGCVTVAPHHLLMASPGPQRAQQGATPFVFDNAKILSAATRCKIRPCSCLEYCGDSLNALSSNCSTATSAALSSVSQPVASTDCRTTPPLGIPKPATKSNSRKSSTPPMLSTGNAGQLDCGVRNSSDK